MTRVVLSLGSNCDAGYVERALEWLGGFLISPVSSGIYRTPAVKQPGKDYDNAVVAAYTDLPLDTLNSFLKAFERMSGRDEECKLKGRVPIDMDIVVWDGSVVREWDFAQEFFRIGFIQLPVTIRISEPCDIETDLCQGK